MDLKIISDEVLKANRRIRNHVYTTPLMHSHVLSKMCDARVYLKLENEQVTGSFKARGSLNKLMALTDDERVCGAITASTGNHALGFARAAAITKTSGTVYLPTSASRAKLEALKAYPIDIQLVEGSSLDTEILAKAEAIRQNKVWVSPYNDLHVMAGQGTVGLEIDDQLDEVDQVLVTVGGGGLIGGTGAYLKTVRPDIRIIGCQPELSPEMTLSIKAGKIVDLETSQPTLSDGSAGGIEEGSITFPVCQRVIDRSILISEAEIREALDLILHAHRKIIEGSAGVAVAALLQQKDDFKGQTVVVVLCGGNISMTILKDILCSSQSPL